MYALQVKLQIHLALPLPSFLPERGNAHSNLNLSLTSHFVLLNLNLWTFNFNFPTKDFIAEIVLKNVFALSL